MFCILNSTGLNKLVNRKNNVRNQIREDTVKNKAKLLQQVSKNLTLTGAYPGGKGRGPALLPQTDAQTFPGAKLMYVNVKINWHVGSDLPTG